MSEILEFTKTMPEKERSNTLELYAYGLWPQPTGSRYICPDAVRDDSDWDLFCMATVQQANSLVENGWLAAGNDGSCGGDGLSLRKGKLNLVVIFPHHSQRFLAFKAATVLCRRAGGPANKPLRVAIFEAYKAHYELSTEAAL